jgi:N-acetylneuraminic acid mutarotase
MKPGTRTGLVLAICLACALVLGSCGSKPNSWINLEPSGPAPSARFGEALLYLSTTGKVFMFGGAADEARPLNDTWTYDPGRNRWVDLKPSGDTPPARWAMGAAYDPAADKVIIFGGMGADGNLLNDTWAYDVTSNAWTELTPSSSPSIRYRIAMAYEQATGRLILFGGRYLRTAAQASFQQDYSDTWAFDLARETWTNLNPSGASPAPSSGSTTLVATGPDGSLVLLAGAQPLPPIPPAIPPDKLNKSWSSWTYDASKNTWMSNRPPASSPPASQYYALVFDSTLRKVVLFGGVDIQNGAPESTWTYDPASNNWALALAGGSGIPSPRIDAGMVYDPKTNKVILFGGRSVEWNEWNTTVLPSETWGYLPLSPSGS